MGAERAERAEDKPSRPVRRGATPPAWRITRGPGPIVAVAIHNGHAVRKEVEARLRLSEGERLREEDPYTAGWTEVVDTRVIGRRSRFEVDLNRPRESAVYVEPEQSWGLRVWEGPLPLDLIARSLEAWDAFYRDLAVLLEEKRARHGRFVVFDIHSYNHRRSGPDGAPADPSENPDVN
ncbi:MAG: N-formylglutamate amidohydrolase, partial [Longimicrobiales bacterium]